LALRALSRSYTSLGNPQFQVEGTAYAQSSIGLTNNQAVADGSFIVFNKTRGTSVGSNTIVQSGDSLGAIWFQGADGTAPVLGATISANVDGTPGANDLPTRLVFTTTDDGAASPTERMRIDSSGNVGIGVTGPSERLAVANGNISHLLGTTSATVNALYDADTASNTYRINVKKDGTDACALAVITQRSGGTNSEAARIDSSGRLLVGTSTSTSATVNGLVGKTQIASSENAALALHGHSSTALYGADIVFTRSRSATIGTNTIVQNGDEFGRIYFTGANGTGFDYGASIQAVVDGTPGVGDMPGRLVFSTTADGASSPTERMRIDNQGRVTIGTSNTPNGIGINLYSNSTSNNDGAFLCGNANTTADACIAAFYTATNSTATSNVLIKFGINNYASGAGQINTNGASAAAFGTFSDARLKENIEDLPSQWDNIKSLRPVEFDYVESFGGGHQIGFIAQEMQTVYPDAVGIGQDEMLTVTAWSKTEARLVRVLQEALERIEQLEAEVAALKTQ
jgi:hypothetical protein